MTETTELVARLRDTADHEYSAIHDLLLEAADRLEALSAPVEMETSEEERRRALDTLGYLGRSTLLAKACRDADKADRLRAEVARLTEELAAEKERAEDWKELAALRNKQWNTSEAARVKAENALRTARGWAVAALAEEDNDDAGSLARIKRDIDEALTNVTAGETT